MKTFTWLLILITISTLASCGSPEEDSNDDPNDQSKKNGEYIWWTNLEGKGEWIKKGEDGTWEPTDGELIDYHENGKTMLIANFLGGKRNGMSINFDEDEDTIMKIYFHMGKADTLFEYFHKNGNVFIEAIKTDQSAKFNKLRVNNPDGSINSIAHINMSESKEASLDSLLFYHSNGQIKYIVNEDSLFIYNSSGQLLESNDAAQTVYILQHIPDHVRNVLLDLHNPNRYFPIFGCISGDCDNGYGEYISPECVIYKGQFKNGFYEGEGKLYTLEEELIYDSEFHLGLPHGFGKYEDENISYEGSFYYGLFQGEGMLTYKYDKIAFSGTFDRDLLQGKVYMHQDGFDSIVANYVDDREHGTTMLYYETGEIVEQKYQFGNLLSEKQIK